MKAIIYLLCVTLFIPGIVNGQNKKPEYFDKYSNRLMSYSESMNEVIVLYTVTQDGTANDQRVEFTKQYKAAKVINTPKLNLAIYSFANETEKSNFTAEAKKYSAISGVYPVLLTSQGNNRYYFPNRISVLFNKGFTEQTMQSIINSTNCIIETKHFTPGFYTLIIPSGSNLFEVITQYNLKEEVLNAEPSYFSLNPQDYVPNDPLYSQQWAFNNSLQYGGTRNSDIFVQEAWDITRGNSNVLVCVMDDGIDLRHDDLYPNIFQNLGEDADHDNKTFEPNGFYDIGDIDTSDNDQNGLINDFCGYNFVDGTYDIQGGTHGTNCAGIIAAVGNNGQGISGIAPLSRILPIKVTENEVAYEDAIIDAIYYIMTAIKPTYPVIISCSWHILGNDPNVDPNPTLHAVINQARKADIPFFFASGNNKNNYVAFPGRYDEVICVGGTNMCDRRWFSNDCNYPTNNWGSQCGPELDICAPAQSVYTTDYEGNAGYVPGDYDDTFTGTSASVPCAAGTGALILSQDNNLDPWQIQEILQKSADKVGGYNYNYNSQKPGHSLELGYGRINAFRAVLSRLFRTETESNNSYTTADGPIVSRMNMAGNISSSGENDWYYFDVTQSGSINISIFGKYKGWFLYSNPQNNYIDYSSVGYEDGVNTKLCSLPAAGRYYLKVTSTFTGNYDFCITGNLLSGALFESEQNNSPAWYDGLINPGQLVSAKIDPSSDVDWFIFEATATGTITVNSTTANKTWSLYRNPSQAALKTATGTSTYNITSTGKYYLKYTGTAGSYDFKVTGNLATCQVESEMNNEYLAADGPLGNGQRIAGNLETASDVDWFYLDVLQTGTLTLKLDGDYKSMYLYSNPTGSYLTQLSVGSQTFATTTYNATQTGRYYLKVTGSADSYYLSVSGNLGKKADESAITDEPVTNTIQTSGPVLWSRNYPNPFAQETTIDFETIEDAPVSVKIYDFKGQEIIRLLDQNNLPAGIHSVIWDGRTRRGMNAENGIYFYTIQCNGSVMHGEMVITR
jgi:hypothetical protein